MADLAVGDAVESKVEVVFRSGESKRELPIGARGTVTEIDRIDAVISFADAPEHLLRMGRYELRKRR